MCVGCGKNVETEEELLVSTGFSDKNERHSEIVSYSWLFSDSVGLMTKVANQIEKITERNASPTAFNSHLSFMRYYKIIHTYAHLPMCVYTHILTYS